MDNPAMSMQKIVWTEKQVNGGRQFDDSLQMPEKNEGYYKDIAVFAYPSRQDAGISTCTTVSTVTSSIAGTDAKFLTSVENTTNFSSIDSCWI